MSTFDFQKVDGECSKNFPKADSTDRRIMASAELFAHLTGFEKKS
jgi:hypothetical protein